MSDRHLPAVPNLQFLESTLVFPNNSREVFTNALYQTQALVKEFGTVYATQSFPNIREPEIETGLRVESASFTDGTLKPPEAVAVLVLMAETAVLAQNFGMGYETAHTLHQVLHLKDGGWQGDAIDAFSHFGAKLRNVAYIRDLLEQGAGLPSEKTIGNKLIHHLHGEFAHALTLDGYKLGENTVQKMVESLSNWAKGHIPANPESAKTPQQLQHRIESFEQGLNLAAKLYLEVRAKASEYFD